MKKIRILLFLTLFLSPVFSTAQLPDSLEACLDSAILHAQRFSLFRHTVDWNALREGAKWRAGFSKTVLDLRPTLQYMLDEMHDPHARFFFKGRPIGWYQGEPTPYQQTIDPKVWGAIQSGRQQFQSAMLPGQTGYLRLVGMPMGDNALLAAPLQAAVCSLQALGARHWIVDLRYNGGGNMFPMLAGVANLLGEGEIGGSFDGDSNRFSTWSIKDGDVYYNIHRSVDQENPCPFPEPPKVAVLTSRYTVSSGEVVAVAFKGRPNTRFFGEPTAGFTTETDWKQLPAGVTMSIATSYLADREGRLYKDSIPADVPATFVPDAEPEQDEAIKKALEWLN